MTNSAITGQRVLIAAENRGYRSLEMLGWAGHMGNVGQTRPMGQSPRSAHQRKSEVGKVFCFFFSRKKFFLERKNQRTFANLAYPKRVYDNAI
jgi:hypothetical protein